MLNPYDRQKDWFVNLDKSVKSKVKFVDDSTFDEAGMGKILIKRKDDKQSFITDVLFVPGMKSNLLSLSQLLEKGYAMIKENNVLTLFDDKQKLILRALLSRNKTFKVGIQFIEHNCYAFAVSREEWLWHYRFGHLTFKDLGLLRKHSMVQGLPHIQQPIERCEECLECKQPRSNFKQQAPTRPKNKLEVVYSDVCRPKLIHLEVTGISYPSLMSLLDSLGNSLGKLGFI